MGAPLPSEDEVVLSLLIALASASPWTEVATRKVSAVQVVEHDELADLTALVSRLASDARRGTASPEAAREADRLSLAVLRCGDVVYLAEPPDQTRGWGVLALRSGPLAQELVLEAPHPWADLETGRLASDLFEAGGVRAVWIATSPRSARDGDPVHTPAHALQSISLGLADALEDPLFVQLHGFGDTHGTMDAVLSDSAVPLTAATLERARDDLEASLQITVSTGVDVPSLAGRTNTTALCLKGRARFVHLELSLPCRDRLRHDAVARRSLAAVLERYAGTSLGRWP